MDDQKQADGETRHRSTAPRAFEQWTTVLAALRPDEPWLDVVAERRREHGRGGADR